MGDRLRRHLYYTQLTNIWNVSHTSLSSPLFSLLFSSLLLSHQPSPLVANFHFFIFIFCVILGIWKKKQSLLYYMVLFFVCPCTCGDSKVLTEWDERRRRRRRRRKQKENKEFAIKTLKTVYRNAGGEMVKRLMVSAEFLKKQKKIKNKK